MSGHTRRLTQLRSRTTPGSYEAPVEGIVDYGAFSAGFEKGIAPGLSYLAEIAKEEEMPDLITLEDFDYTGTASKSGALGVSTEASNSMNLGIDNKIRDIQARLDSAVVRKDVNLQRDIMNEYNTLKKVVVGAQTAFGSIASGEGAIDARQARNIKIGRNDKGEGLSWYDISTIGNQKDSTFEFVTNANGTGGLRVNGYYFDTTSINKNSVSKITPLLGGLDAALKSYQSESPLERMQRTQATTKKGLQQSVTSRITDDSYKNIDIKAAGFAKTIVENNATKNANLLDFMYGEGGNFGGEASLFMQSLITDDEFKGYEDKYNLSKEETFQKISELVSTANNSLTTEQLKEKVEISTKILTLGAENAYKLNVASEAYVIDPKTGRAIKRDDLVNTKQLDPEGDEGGGLNLNFGGIGVDQNLYNVISETDKFGRSDDVAGTLFFTKDLPTGDNQNPRFDQEMLVSVNPSASGGKEKQVIFNLNNGDDKPKFIVYDFGYSMAEDAPKVYLDKEGNPVEKGSRGAIEIIPKTAQEYVQSRFSSEANQNKYSKTINDVYDTRKKNFAKKQNFMRQWISNNPGTKNTNETDEEFNKRRQREAEIAYRIELQRQNQ